MTAVDKLREARAIPRLGGGLPLLGHALEFRHNPVGLIQRGRDLFGDIFSFTLLGKRVNALTGPSANAAFFKAPDHVLSSREAYQFTVPIFGKGVAYDVSPETMDAQLRLVHPALRDEKMQSYVRFIADETEACIDRWENEGCVDLLAALNEITIYAAGRCLIGAEFRNTLSREFVDLYHDLEGGINLVAFFAPHLPLPAMLRRNRARKRVAALISGLVAARKSEGRETDDFLNTLMQARDAHGDHLHDDTITGLLLTLLFAGQHTSAVLATWAGVLLMQDADVMSHVLAEQNSVLTAQKITFSAIRHLEYLDACIKEAERLHPPLVMLMRKVLKPFELDGFVIRPGELALVSPATSHRVPEVFAEPLRYDPNRFLAGREEDRRTPYGLIGFGGGKHRCIGLAFAYQQVKVIWTMLLRRYSFSLVEECPQPDYRTFVVSPRAPCLVRYRRRAN